MQQNVPNNNPSKDLIYLTQKLFLMFFKADFIMFKICTFYLKQNKTNKRQNKRWLKM